MISQVSGNRGEANRAYKTCADEARTVTSFTTTRNVAITKFNTNVTENALATLAQAWVVQHWRQDSALQGDEGMCTTGAGSMTIRPHMAHIQGDEVMRRRGKRLLQGGSGEENSVLLVRRRHDDNIS